MSSLTMSVDILPGTDFKVAVREAKVIAERLSLAGVEFEFNGVEVFVRPDSDEEELKRYYQDRLRHLELTVNRRSNHECRN